MTFRPILLVEDSPRDVELTIEALKLSNMLNEIVVVSDGQEALDYLRRDGRYSDHDRADPCFVLLDLKLPKVTGLEVLAIMKRDARLRSIPVVMLTASREEGDVVTSYELGTNAYVVKPIAFSEFLQAIRDIGAFWGILNTAPQIAQTEALGSVT
jgi:CheY-like chemotaxis protein